jgi:hypothetical protein
MLGGGVSEGERVGALARYGGLEGGEGGSQTDRSVRGLRKKCMYTCIQVRGAGGAGEGESHRAAMTDKTGARMAQSAMEKMQGSRLPSLTECKKYYIARAESDSSAIS